MDISFKARCSGFVFTKVGYIARSSRPQSKSTEILNYSSSVCVLFRCSSWSRMTAFDQLDLCAVNRLYTARRQYFFSCQLWVHFHARDLFCNITRSVHLKWYGLHCLMQPSVSVQHQRGLFSRPSYEQQAHHVSQFKVRTWSSVTNSEPRSVTDGMKTSRHWSRVKHRGHSRTFCRH